MGGGQMGGGQMGGGTSLPTAAPQDSKVDSDTQNKGKPSNAAFLGGDQGWIDLKLESVEELSHNTKKFRFALPNEDDISGLHIASAVLTKYKGPEMAKVSTFPSVFFRFGLTPFKPVIRPYTPTSDEGWCY